MADRLNELQSTGGDGEASPTASGSVTPVRGTDHIVRSPSGHWRADSLQKGAIEAHQALLRDPNVVRPHSTCAADCGSPMLSDKRAPRPSSSCRRWAARSCVDCVSCEHAAGVSLSSSNDSLTHPGPHLGARARVEHADGFRAQLATGERHGGRGRRRCQLGPAGRRRARCVRSLIVPPR